MQKDTIITIGRQFGSHGREVGQFLAKRLDIPFYDREIVSMASQDSRISEEVLEHSEEKAPNGWGISMFSTYEAPMSDKIFITQSAVIQRLANKGPCVIVGRSADYVLRANPNCVSVFIHADWAYRLANAQKMLTDIPVEKLEQTIRKVDKEREKYYNYYTGQKWGAIETYHLSINSAKIGPQNCARLIEEFIAMRV